MRVLAQHTCVHIPITNPHARRPTLFPQPTTTPRVVRCRSVPPVWRWPTHFLFPIKKKKAVPLNHPVCPLAAGLSTSLPLSTSPLPCGKFPCLMFPFCPSAMYRIPFVFLSCFSVVSPPLLRMVTACIFFLPISLVLCFARSCRVVCCIGMPWNFYRVFERPSPCDGVSGRNGKPFASPILLLPPPAPMFLMYT